MGLGIDFNFAELQRALTRQLTELQRQVVPRATRIALERVAITLRKEGATEIRKELNISAARAKDAIDVRARDASLVLTVSPKPIGLRDFDAKQTPKGVSYKFGPRSGRKVWRNKYGGSFIVAKISGHAFVRTSNKSLPITKLSGPSAASAFRREQVQSKINEIAQERFAVEFQRALQAIA